MPSSTTIPEVDNLEELLDRLGNIPVRRILMHPAPGTATEEDALRFLDAANKRLVELVDGALVEKPMGSRESLLGGYVHADMTVFVRKHRLGHVLPGDGALRIMAGLIRAPDASFIGWERMPNGFPKERIAELVPHLAVEVISEGNTKGEMKRKLKDYFLAGVQVVWFIYPKTQTAEVYTGPDQKKRIGKNGSLDGGDVLPGFSLSLPELFAAADETPDNR
jgi:Uma2 family endonuclease